jgi:hypothetical protein
VTTRTATIGFVVLFFVAVAALVAYRLLDVWLPRRVGEAITERFGEYVTIGEVRYVFPLGVEIRDVVFVRRPRSFISGEASRVRVKLRPSAIILLRFDARLLKEFTTDNYAIYLYPLELRRPVLTEPRSRAPTEFSGPGPLVEGATSPRGNAAPPESRAPAAAPPREISVAEPGKAKPAPFDFAFAAKNGRVILRGEGGDTVILQDVDAGGWISNETLEVALSGRTTRRRSFEFSAEHSFVTKEGSARYNVEAVEAVRILPWVGRPAYLLEAEGTLTFEGTLRWQGGKLDHRATGRLSRGRLVLAPDGVQVRLEDVNFQFTLHNADFTVDEGSCRAAEVRWHFGGRVSKLSLELTFRSENMTLQNLVDIFVGEVRVRYAGVGVAELRIYGTPREPRFYIRVEREDK